MSNHISYEKSLSVISMLCEGGSIRAIERMTGIHRDTIMRIGLRIGRAALDLHNKRVRNLSLNHIQVDEMWGYIHAKDRAVRDKNIKKEAGSVWLWVALDSETKLVPAFIAGRRDMFHADLFMKDLSSRLIGKTQISSDGFNAYPDAIRRNFDLDTDYAMAIKVATAELMAKHNPRPQCRPDPLKLRTSVSIGSPDMERCSTNHIEKLNHTTRMHCRRLSRLTNAFSKKSANFSAAVTLHFAYYNFCKRHGSLRTTPAVAAGVEEKAWTLAEFSRLLYDWDMEHYKGKRVITKVSTGDLIDYFLRKEISL